MRIITGIYKGRHFDIPRTFKARPTTDFAKENIFNVLNGYIDFDGASGLDLFSGTGSISFLRTEGNKFKALVIPQSIPASSNFITVTLGGKTYSMEKSFTFVGGHRYQFTLTVRKTSNGINVDINDWVDDDVDNGGVAE